MATFPQAGNFSDFFGFGAVARTNAKMPKRAKKAWRKNINLDDYYEGLERTRTELARGYVFWLTTNLICSVAS